jgi:hypothetical protein
MGFHKHQTRNAGLRAWGRRDVAPGLDLSRYRAP